LNDFGYPYVSICVPAYEQTEYLSKLMDSILNQDFNNYEVIISDDSKTDAVKDLISSKYAPVLGNKLRYYRNMPSLGSPANWNNAIAYSTGDIIHLIHHDDYYYNSKSLSDISSLFKEDVTLDFVIGKVYSYNDHLKELKEFVTDTKKYNILCSNIIFSNNLGPPSVLIFKRNAILEYDTNLQWFVDTEYYYRIFKRGIKGKYSSRPFIVSVNNGAHNLTRNLQDNLAVELSEYVYIYRKHGHFPLAFIKFIKHFSDLINKYGLYSVEFAHKALNQKRLPITLKILIIINRYVFIIKKGKE
jgi:glycosyltransferase involved in cell wall biosynthesis